MRPSVYDVRFPVLKDDIETITHNRDGMTKRQPEDSFPFSSELEIIAL
jgi:hypothetical protein